MKNEKEVIETEIQSKKPKLNNAIMLFAVITLGVGIWFGSSMIGNTNCNAKVVKVMKDIKVHSSSATETPAKK